MIFEHESCVIAKFKDHLHFNHRLKEHNLLPQSLRFNPPVKSKEGYRIANKAGLAYLRLRISNCHTIIKEHSKILADVSARRQETLDMGTFDSLKHFIMGKTQWETQQRRARHTKKLAKIIPATNVPDKVFER